MPIEPETFLIGFPPGLLGPSAQRLVCTRVGDGLLAVFKPGGVVSDAHPFYPEVPSLVAGINAQLFPVPKPELIQAGFEKAYSVGFWESELEGLALIAQSKRAAEVWRNRLGSLDFTFRYRFLCETLEPLEPDERVCSLPVAQHFGESRALISHKTGKKAETRFVQVGRFGRWSLWEAQSRLFRLHQLRLHAAEAGLRIVGESLYEGAPEVSLRALKGRFAKGFTVDRPLHEGPAIFACAVKISPDGGVFELPVGSKTAAFLRQVERFTSKSESPR